ncbi:hypothetical protein JQN58_12145 [Aneurinibacillus sp. BA2021]|nr:hypothetical protein [Aneurinibacillus sp. BA2021]
MPEYCIDAESVSACLWFDAIRGKDVPYEQSVVTLHLGEYEVVCQGHEQEEGKKTVLFSTRMDAESMEEATEIWEHVAELLLDYVSFSAGFTMTLDTIIYTCAAKGEKQVKQRHDQDIICYNPDYARKVLGDTINSLQSAMTSPQIRNALHYMRIAEELQRDPKLRMLMFTKALEAIIGHARKQLPWVLKELNMDATKEDVQRIILNLRNAADIAHSPNDPTLLHSDFDITPHTLIEAHELVSQIITRAMKYVAAGEDLTKLKISYFDDNK